MSCFQTLKEKGYKLTPQRVAVLQVLHQSDGHITAADIYQKVQARYPHVNKSTVYRTLELLKELRLVTETDLGGGRFCYHQLKGDITTISFARGAAGSLT